MEAEEEYEDDEANEEAVIPRTAPNRQVAKRRPFTLYEKMAADPQIQNSVI